MLLKHLRDLTVEAPPSEGPAFISAASGIVLFDRQLWVVADDAHFVARFSLDGDSPGKLTRLIDRDLPVDAAERKQAKPDFEILLALPGEAHHRLLALGSGSTENRMRGAIIDTPAGDDPATVTLVDLRPLFGALSALLPQTNLEGAVLIDDRLILFNRGHMGLPVSDVVEVSLSQMIGGGPVGASVIAQIALPNVAGVPLTVTDACRLENGHIILSAVAEATDDSYADGELAGAAFVELDAEFGVLTLRQIEQPIKIEGIAAFTANGKLQLLCVSDADDPGCPSALFQGVWD